MSETGRRSISPGLITSVVSGAAAGALMGFLSHMLTHAGTPKKPAILSRKTKADRRRDRFKLLAGGKAD